MLEEGVGDHRHERVTVKALPASSLQVIEAEFLFELLMGLFADPLMVAAKVRRSVRRGEVGKIVFLLALGSVFAEEPDLVPREMLLTLLSDPLRRSVGRAHTDWACPNRSFVVSIGELVRAVARLHEAKALPTWPSN